MIEIEPLSFITGFSVGLLLFIGYNLADIVREFRDEE